jgi:hypothetical protein
VCVCVCALQPKNETGAMADLAVSSIAIVWNALCVYIATKEQLLIYPPPPTRYARHMYTVALTIDIQSIPHLPA